MRLTLAVLLAWCGTAAAADPAYEAEVRAFRAEHEARISSDEGWLAVVGLFWLEDGKVHRLGTAPENEIVLPPGTAAPAAGTIERRGRTITLRRAEAERVLLPDTAGKRDVVELGRMRLFVIERGDRFGLRVIDLESPARKAFRGLPWYPVDERFRIVARFVPHARPRTISVPNVLGQAVPMTSPGKAVFRVGRKRVALEAVAGEGAEELWFIFSDRTAEKTTYGGGRFLYTPLPEDGRVVLDFNKAESPPCAYTEFATCPLPPPQNRLPVAIEAGERYVAH
jgi:uncharacterized protein (DUF1684 family)